MPTIHEGHRERLKKQFEQSGLDSFSDVQVLELLLFYAVPRRDTNPIAHKLLDTFGSLSQVLEASREALCRVEGVGESTASFLRLITETGRRYAMDKSAAAAILPTLESCADYMVPYFYGKTVETVYLLCLDAKCRVLGCKEVGQGSTNATGVSVRRIVEVAMGSQAASVVLAHNHPGGLALPSAEDVATTRRIASALQAVDIVLTDHIIVADGDYVSLAMSGENFRDCLLI